jgi:hypothetical protein
MSRLAAHLRANAIAYLALFFALSTGGAYAAGHLAKNSVGAKQLKKNAVVSSKVKNGSLRAADFGAGQLPAGAKGVPGPVGPQGPPGPASGAAGGDLSGSYPDPAIAAGAVTPAKIGTIPAARVTQGGGERLNNNATKALPFEVEEYDTANLHSDADPTLLTAPIDGVYEVSGGIAWEPAENGLRSLAIVKNGSFYVARDIIPAFKSTTEITAQSIASQVELHAGESVELRAEQNSGGSLAFYASGLSFAMTWLAPAR